MAVHEALNTGSYRLLDELVDGIGDDALIEAVEEAEKDLMYYLSIILSNVFLFFLIFGLSATVDVVNLKRQMKNKFAIGTGVAMQFAIMPLLGYCAVIALRDQGLTHAMGITLLVVTSSPGGSYSNWWCSTFNADLALSVTMTSISSVLSIAMLPANLFLYTYLAYGVTENGSHEEQSVVDAIDFRGIFISLGVVMTAIITGLMAGYAWDTQSFHANANRLGSVCGIFLIATSLVLSSGAEDTESNFYSLPWSFYVGVAFPCIVGVVVANFIANSFQLSKPECVTISVECCYQNVGIATSVAVTMFDDPEERAQAISVPLLYGFVEAFVVGFYCLWSWKMGWTKAPADENMCVVMAKTYEVQEAGEEGDEDHDNQNNHHGAIIPQSPNQKEEEGLSEVKEVEEGMMTPEKKSKSRSTSAKDSGDVQGSFWSRLFSGKNRRQEDASTPATRGRNYSEDYTASTMTETPSDRCRLHSDDFTTSNNSDAGRSPSAPSSSQGILDSIREDGKEKSNSKDDDHEVSA